MQVTPGEVHHIYSDQEFDHVLNKHADQLVIVCASSMDCVPCKAFDPAFKVWMLLVAKADCVHCLLQQCAVILVTP